MKEVGACFIGSIERTPSVISFRFSPKEELEFMPGQFSQLVFDEKDKNNNQLNKYLSFSCAPGKGYIEVTKRLSASAFSQRLRALKTGDELLFKTPLGSCAFKEEYKKIAFLIGGIGITPVISIIEYIMDKHLETDVCLAYSNRSEEEIAFKKELDSWQSINSKIKVSYLVSDCQPKDASCIFGRIDEDLLKEHICDMEERIVFIYGPPKMVEVMHNLCSRVGCVKERIKTESFVGY